MPRRHALVGVLGCLVGLAGCAGSQRSESPPARIDSIGSSDGSVKTMNQSQLQGLVQGMADTLTLGTAQATFLMEEHAKTPRDRRAVHTLKYLSATAAVEIAVCSGNTALRWMVSFSYQAILSS